MSYNMFGILRKQGNVNYNYFKFFFSCPCYCGQVQTSTNKKCCEVVGKEEPSFIVGWITNWCSHHGNQYEKFSKM